MSINRLYNTTITINRLTPNSTGHKESYQALSEDVDCVIHPASREETALGDGAFFKLYKMYCDRDVDIQIGDQVINDANGVTYQVKGVADYNFGNDTNNHLIVSLVEGI